MDQPQLPASHEALLEHAAWMRKLAVELVRDPGTADDLVQETWLAFLRARPDMDRPLRPWLSRVVRNAAALSMRRGAGRSARETEAAQSERLPSAHELVERAEQQQRLSEAVLALDEPYRTTILLRYYEGLTPQEIATSQGVPPGTVRSQLHRGLAKLRERLDREHDGDRKAWVVMLQPLLRGPEAAAGVGLPAGTLVGLAALCAAMLLIYGLAWTSGDKGVRALDSEHSVVGGPDDELTWQRSMDEGRVVVEGPATGSTRARRRSWLLVDKRTHASLPGYVLRTEGQNWRSDAEGRIELPIRAREFVPIDDARLALEVSSGHDRRVTRRIEREAQRLPEDTDEELILLAAGPTYRLQLTPLGAVHVELLEARLVAEGPDGYGTGLRPQQVAPVRDGAGRDVGHWVRFAELPEGFEDTQLRWRLELRDQAGLWSGSSPITDLAPQIAPTISIDLQPTGVVTGRVDGLVDERARDASVALFLPGARDTALYWTKPTAEGDYALRHVPPGAYELRASVPGQEPWWGTVEVRGGESVTLDCALDPLASAGPVAGAITSQSGRYRGQLLVFLLDAEGRTLDVYPTSWRESEGGALEASFRFDEAPVGELRLDAVSLQDAVTFGIDVQDFRAPLEDLRVTVLDQLPATDWAFTVADAATGDELSRYQVAVRLTGGGERRYRAEALDQADAGTTLQWTLIAGGLRWNRFESRGPLRRLPTVTRFEWTVSAEGYRPSSGSEAAFGPDPAGGGRIAPVRLEPE